MAKGCVQVVSRMRRGLESVGRRVQGKKVESKKRSEMDQEEKKEVPREVVQ